MNINTDYKARYVGTAMPQTNANTQKTQTFDALSQTKTETDDTTAKLTEQQKNYLRGKYRLEDLTFNYDLPGDEFTARTFKPFSFDFMKDLRQMGLISEKEYNTYLEPTMWAFKPLNYNSLPEEMQKGFCHDPLAEYEFVDAPDNRTAQEKAMGRTLRANPSGMNLLDAFRTLEFQQERRSKMSLGTADQELYAQESKMYGRLADLISEIFA